MDTSLISMLKAMSISYGEEEGKPGYKPAQWRWNAKSDEFQFIDTYLVEMINSRLNVRTISGLLDIMSAKDRKKLVNALQSTHECNSKRSLFSVLTPSKGFIIYCEIEVSHAKGDELYGHIRPLFYLSSMYEMGQIFQAVFENRHHGIVITDSDTRILACNPYFIDRSGYELSELLGRKTNLFNAGKHSDTFFEEIWRQVHREGHWSGTILSKRANGDTEPQDLTIQKIEMANGKTYFVGFTVDLSNHLYRIADTEYGGIELLTQLPNENEFGIKLASLVRHYSSSHTIIVLAVAPDFDEASTLDQRVAFSNAVAQVDDHYLCGYKGDNLFVCALKCPNSGNRVRAIHTEIRRFMAAIRQFGNEHLFQLVARGKVGVSVLGYDTSNPKMLVTHATQAMLEQHSSKKGNNISFFDRTMHEETVRRKKLEEILTNFIKDENIDVHFQPIVSTETWQVVKFEALCRFPSSEGLRYTPQEMINIAEDLNLVAALDKIIGSKSLKYLSKIHQHFGKHVGITINRSLNTRMSAQQVLTNALNMVEESGVNPKLVTIELTESAYFDSEDSQIEALKALRQKGVQVAIDDFGTGYSSFTYLSNGHFDYLKIDREFIFNIEIGSHKYFIVKMLVDLSHTLGVTVIAEGVETIQEIEVLTGLGVDYIQGYYFSKPVPIAEIERARHYLNKRNELRAYTLPKQGAGILSLHEQMSPFLEPSTAMKEVHEIFMRTDLDVLVVTDSQHCVGVVDREVYNLHMTPTFGTKLETQRDSQILKRKLSQVMKTQFTVLSHATLLKDVPGLVNKGVPLPWVIAGDKGECLGVVSKAKVLKFLAK
ncbi:EAL domain-containing protein [Vibrio sp. SCSIO 43132]|uniref:sensor domain-containing phosphodiesterase n=1 Tax=Vibrio sp. SCSIO 43132 TaxID=2779363 RepID=UPI001CAA257F|nr:EAL domain-containing protein [Vibrio sp. SCSIO 43132]UAB69229.1 EAL domain-containing protein [Vibrio sp. SCSIO 43132]